MGVNIGEGNELVWSCRVGDEHGYDMVVIGKMGWRRIDIVAQCCVRKDKM